MNRKALIAGIGASTVALRRGAIAQNMPVLRVIGPPIDAMKSVYYGVKAGIFKKYGLDVQPSILANGAAATAALVGGAAEVSFSNSLTLFQAHARGIPIRFIAPSILLTSDHATTQTVVKSSSAIKSGRDLVGKTIGSSSVKDMNAVATFAWIDMTGGDAKNVKMIEVPATSAAAMLEEGRVDAVTLNEPAVGAALASGKARTIAKPYDAIAKRLQAGGFAAMDAYVEKNTDMMKRFVRALHEAQVYTNAHPADTAPIVAAFSGIPADVVAHSVRMIDPEYLEVRNLQPLIEAMVKYGALEAPFNAADVISPIALKAPRSG